VAAIEKGVIRTAHCQFCHACIDHCPNTALAIVDVWAQRKRQEEGKTPAKPPVPSESPLK
jgi:formate hydrogenlyase subunit 6/NADH:ubiquinone oxidoreductase subunit I